MHPEMIKAALKMRGSSQAEIATECEVTPTSVHQVIEGRMRSERIETSISTRTGFSLAELWPQWHTRQRSRELSKEQLVQALRSVA